MAENIPTTPGVQELLGEKFTPMERRKLGATASAHQVEFGYIEGEAVAVKPFASNYAHQKARHEEKLTTQVAELGFDTVEPLEVIGPIALPDENRKHVALLVSRYMPDLKGAQTLTYADDPETERGKAIRKTVETMITSLGGLHGGLVTHGDPQLRNFAFKADKETGFLAPVPVVFDFESGLAHRMKGIGRQMFVDLTKKDVSKLMISLGDRQFGGPDAEIAADVARDTVIQPYLESSAVENIGSFAISQLIDDAQQSFAIGRQGNRPSHVQPEPVHPKIA